MLFHDPSDASLVEIAGISKDPGDPPGETTGVPRDDQSAAKVGGDDPADDPADPGPRRPVEFERDGECKDPAKKEQCSSQRHQVTISGHG